MTAKLDLIGAYYRYDQNSFKGNGCSDTSAGSCSGQLWDVSAVADYRFNKRFDVYGGVNHFRSRQRPGVRLPGRRARLLRWSA